MSIIELDNAFLGFVPTSIKAPEEGIRNTTRNIVRINHVVSYILIA